jgi:hypothetical protein
MEGIISDVQELVKFCGNGRSKCGLINLMTTECLSNHLSVLSKKLINLRFNYLFINLPLSGAVTKQLIL